MTPRRASSPGLRCRDWRCLRCEPVDFWLVFAVSIVLGFIGLALAAAWSWWEEGRRR